MKMQKKFLFAGCAAMLCLAGCETGKDVEIHIQDGYTETILMANDALTVQEAIEEAEITLNDKDQVIPELGSSISELDSSIQIKRHAKGNLNVDGKVTEFELNGEKVEQLIEQYDIALDDNDFVNYDLECYLENGMEIEVIHRQAVKLIVNGRESEVITSADTVEELLEMEEISLGENDRISPKLSKKIKEGMTVSLKRVTVKKEVVTEVVPFTTRTVTSSSMYKGTSKVTQAGINGEKEVTYEITMVDGKEESSEIVEEKVIKQPVEQIVTIGSKVKQSGKTIVSKKKVMDCDGSGHGYYIITYSDGTVDYKEF